MKRNMQRLAFIVVLGAAMMQACQGQKKEVAKDNGAGEQQNLVTPRVDIKVNKKYDDKGNLIGLDSTYSSYFSKVKGDTLLMDSLFRQFNKNFTSRHPSLLDQHFHELFFNDSLFYDDFFHNDFFEKRYELNDAYLRNTMRRLDSIKNEFYRQHSLNTPPMTKPKKK